MVVVSPSCGEHVRKLLSTTYNTLKAKPVKHYLRTSIPCFPITDIKTLRNIAGKLLGKCKGLIEIVEGSCIVQEKWSPPASYVIVGSIAIVSIDDSKTMNEWYSIAENILLHNPSLRAVYGKISTVGEFRVQKLVHLAGEQVHETIYVEHGLRYPVPLGKVYINPRFATEHLRIAEMVKEGEYVLDMFAGVGGFSLLISAKRRARIVVANDLNIYAIKALLSALRLNKGLIRTPILVLQTDARNLPLLLKPVFNRIIMNLPHESKKFLDVALKLCNPERCIVHLYTIARNKDEAREGIPSRLSIIGMRRVLDYAPRKFIYRLDILVGRGKDHVED